MQSTPETELATDLITTLPLSVLRPSKINPRRHLSAIESLAASIEADGLLHNLLVVAGKGRNTYDVLDGCRRLPALKLLQKRGKLPKGWTDWQQVPVAIRANLSEADRRRLGIVANVQREQLHPLDEADAWLAILETGTPVDDLAAMTGFTLKTIKRRLALSGLCEAARNAYREGSLSLSQAQALTGGTSEQQAELLQRIEGGTWWYDAEEIRDILLSQRPTVSMAIFPIEDYQGRIDEDWFSDDDSRYFDDAEQFMRLQRAAVEALAQKYRDEGTAWVEIDDNPRSEWWKYDKARKGSKTAGVVIWFGPLGDVEVREGLRKRKLEPTVTAPLDTVDVPRPKTPRPAYGGKLCLEIGRQKTLAVQAALIANPRKAREIAVMQLLTGDYGLYKVQPHGSLHTTRNLEERPDTYGIVDAAAQRLLVALGSGETPAGDSPGWFELLHGHRWGWRSEDLYPHVRALSDADLETLHLLLPVLAFGQQSGERLDTEASLFNTVAQDLDIRMRDHWRPDEAFLSMRTKPQLLDIAKESGAVEAAGPLPDKKKALVKVLADYFTGHSEAARTWLPGAMAFPAVDPGTEAAEPVGRQAGQADNSTDAGDVQVDAAA